MRLGAMLSLLPVSLPYRGPANLKVRNMQSYTSMVYISF